MARLNYDRSEQERKGKFEMRKCVSECLEGLKGGNVSQRVSGVVTGVLGREKIHGR